MFRMRNIEKGNGNGYLHRVGVAGGSMDIAAALRFLRSFVRRVAWRVAMIIVVGTVLSLIGWHKAHAYGHGTYAVVPTYCGKYDNAQACFAEYVTLRFAAAAAGGPASKSGSPVCVDIGGGTMGCSGVTIFTYWPPPPDGDGSIQSRQAVTNNYNPVTQGQCVKGAVSVGGAGSQICECPLGLKPVGGECKPYSCSAKGSYTAVTQPDVTVDNVGPICMSGCTVTPASTKVADDGSLYATWPFVSEGQTCGGKAISTADPVKSGEDKIGDPPVRCGANMCPGSVNGAQVCVACKSTNIPGPSSSASGPGGAASGATPSIPNAPAGTVTTSQSTSCTQSVCTTTTVFKGAGGEVLGSKTEEKGQDSFCKDNPDATICKKGAWGGNCGAYSCDGDAVQCAIAQRIHKTACEWEEVDPGLKTAGERALAGELRPDGHPGNNGTETSMSFGSVIDRSDALGGGGCPGDVAVSVAGHSYVIPWSRFCPQMQLVGQLAVAVCMLAAAVIVFRS